MRAGSVAFANGFGITQAGTVVRAVMTTMRRHWTGSGNDLRHRTTQGVLAGMKNRLKLMKRQANGFVKFNHFRERLLACFAN